MKKYTVVVIGLGNIGLFYDFEPQRLHPATHVMAWEQNPEAELLCGVDRDTSRAMKLREVAPLCNFSESISEAVASYRPDIVSICTPPQFHLSNIEEVFAAGSPRAIFCEKPLAKNLDEAARIKRLAEDRKCLVVPNISRRWNSSLRGVFRKIADERYGRLQKIHVRYTRGIYNTGAHLFDLLRMWTGKKIDLVQTLKKVPTSSESEGEESFSFFFEQSDGIHGYAEAMNDEFYYMFDIDLFFESGKIEMRDSGNRLLFYGVGTHHLFEGFKELRLETEDKDIFHESCMKHATQHIVDVLKGRERPCCTLGDAVYPLQVAMAIEKSSRTKRREKVMYDGW